MKRWVGLGVIADNLINIGHAMEKGIVPPDVEIEERRC
jgi:hypothetical protein